jgi:hypothetical protein
MQNKYKLTKIDLKLKELIESKKKKKEWKHPQQIEQKQMLLQTD